MTNGSLVTSGVVVLALVALTFLVVRGRARRDAARAAEARRAREREEELGREVRERLAALSESPHAWQHARDEAARQDAETEPLDLRRGSAADRDPWSSRGGAGRPPRHADGDHGLGRTG
jgi:hypothetical protein